MALSQLIADSVMLQLDAPYIPDYRPGLLIPSLKF